MADPTIYRTAPGADSYVNGKGQPVEAPEAEAPAQAEAPAKAKGLDEMTRDELEAYAEQKRYPLPESGSGKDGAVLVDDIRKAIKEFE